METRADYYLVVHVPNDQPVAQFEDVVAAMAAVACHVAFFPEHAPMISIRGFDAEGNEIERIKVRGPKRSYLFDN